MSLLRCTSVIAREPQLFRCIFASSAFSKTIPRYGFATNKARPSKEGILKRPPNSFQLFAEEYRDLAVKEFPDKSPKEIRLILGEKWKGMSEDEKTSYKKVYAERLEVYNAPLSKLPKKPPAVFGLFVKENYSRVERENPEAAVTKIISMLSERWNELPAPEKEEWKRKYDSLIEVYKQQVMGFGKDLSADERAFLQQKRGPEMHKLEKEKRKLLGYPKRPPSPFIVFMQNSEGRAENESVVERAKKLGQRWKELREQDKEVYREESRKSREQHILDVAKWKENNS